jgi:hypothetical protein
MVPVSVSRPYAVAMPLVSAVQADQHVGAGALLDIRSAALGAVVLTVLQFLGRGVDGHRVGRQHFVADGLGQGGRIHRERARFRRHILR